MAPDANFIVTRLRSDSGYSGKVQWLAAANTSTISSPANQRSEDVGGVRRVGCADHHRIEVGPELRFVAAERRIAGACRRALGGGRLRIENLRPAAADDERKEKVVRLASPAESDDADPH